MRYLSNLKKNSTFAEKQNQKYIIFYTNRQYMSSHLRNITYDYAKGFAIILVVLFHIIGITSRETCYHIYLFCQLSQLTFFFYISGVLLFRQINKSKVKEKSIRLLLPFFSFYIIWCLFDINNIINFQMDEFKHGYWFIFVLFEMIIVIYISTIITDKLRKNITAIHLFTYFIISLLWYLCPRNGFFYNFFSINQFWHYYPFFIVGTYNSSIKKIFATKNILLFFILFFVSFYLYFKNPMQLLKPICNVFSFLFFMTLFENGFRPFQSTIARVGKSTMQIYVIHFFLIKFLKLIPSNVTNNFMWLFLNPIITFLIIYITLWISKIIQKNKSLRLVLFGMK